MTKEQFLFLMAIDAFKRAATKRLGAAPRLDPRVAVISVDGDKMGRLIAGDPMRVRATWRDVLHPDALKQLEAFIAAESPPPWARVWRAELGEVRAMGPSLHAWLSRALTRFANEIVPWVVEREFHGRLIYAGGDDVLALGAVDEAAAMAARLQQLWSASWVVDTRPAEHATDWRKRDFVHDPARDRGRFLVARPAEGVRPLDLPVARVAVHAAEGPAEDSRAVDLAAVGQDPGWRLLPMLGPGQSVSAGIAYGHFKTPLGELILASDDALRRGAKEGAGEAALAEVVHSRSGAKACGVVRWDGPGGRGSLAGWEGLRRVREAFRSGGLPRGLPYKLRELSPLLAAVARDEGAAEGRGALERVARGFVSQALADATEVAPAVREAVARLWLEGLRDVVGSGGAGRARWRCGGRDGAAGADAAIDRAADTLLVQRELVSSPEDV